MKLIILALVCVPAWAQTPAASVRKPPADCSDPDARLACRSFTQLLESRDADIIAVVKPAAYVCFRPKEDAFFVVGFDPPPKNILKERDQSVSQTGVVQLSEYRNGVSGMLKTAVGEWLTTPPIAGTPGIVRFLYSSEGKPYVAEEKLSVSIFPDELNLHVEYRNGSGALTDRSISIRRSTGRFVDTFAVKEKALDFEFTGRCLIYK